MDNERRKALISTMKSLNKEFKQDKKDEDTLFFGDEIENKGIIPTGIKSVDEFFGGGFKRGSHTIIWGGISNGKTTLALQAIADAQKKGLICAYLNTEKPIDNERFDMLGVNRSELIRANCAKNAEQTLTIVQRLCKEKVIDLIVVDSINALCPKAELETKKGKKKSLEDKTIAELARLLSEFCRKVNADVYNADCAMVWIGQLRIGGIGTFYTRATLSCGEAMKFYAYNIAYLRRGESDNAPVKKRKEYFIDPDGKVRFQTKSEKIGFDSVMRMDKTNSGSSAKEHTEVHFPFVGARGFVDKVSENIPITIDSDATKLEKKIIEDYLVKKEIYPPVTVEGDKKAKIRDANEEETKKIEDYLVKKEIYPPIISESEVVIHKVTLADGEGNEEVLIDNTEDEQEKLKNIISEKALTKPKKRGRGRPKKEKK